MTIYWIILEVDFEVPLPSQSSELRDSLGFVKTFGCTFSSEREMKTAILSEVRKEPWIEAHRPKYSFDISVIHPNDVQSEIYMDEDIREHLESSPTEAGVWYKGARIFFSDGEGKGELGHIVEVKTIDTQ